MQNTSHLFPILTVLPTLFAKKQEDEKNNIPSDQRSNSVMAFRESERELVPSAFLAF